jgi:hypothetical protein
MIFFKNSYLHTRNLNIKIAIMDLYTKIVAWCGVLFGHNN